MVLSKCTPFLSPSESGASRKGLSCLLSHLGLVQIHTRSFVQSGLHGLDILKLVECDRNAWKGIGLDAKVNGLLEPSTDLELRLVIYWGMFVLDWSTSDQFRLLGEAHEFKTGI